MLLRLLRTSRFFVVVLQIFCWGWDISLPHISRFFVKTKCIQSWAESIFAMFGKMLGHMTLMTIPHWLRYVPAPANVLVHRTLADKARQAPILSQTCLNSLHAH